MAAATTVAGEYGALRGPTLIGAAQGAAYQRCWSGAPGVSGVLEVVVLDEGDANLDDQAAADRGAGYYAAAYSGGL
ncbi:hypothetical protein GCM10009744_32300 [Kribbella alba]|uniref:Uncharacterized protein n=1 Tax=Kribbella alba TaxID=190197 RepID=A0ABN2FC49_9ACTN